MVEQCPDQVHDKVEYPKRYLKNLALFPWGDILRSHSLGSSNASICELVVNSWNCLSIDDWVVRFKFELGAVDVVMNKNVA